MTERKAWSLVALFFLLHVVLALPVLTPRLKDIGAFDEAGYVEMGRTLGLHNLPALNEYPLPALFFALTYIPVHTSDFWFVHSCALGRFLLLLLLWLSAYIAARQISEIPSPLIMIGLLLLSPATLYLCRNAAHALFTAMSTLALAQLVLFQRTRALAHVWMASGFVSLAMLSRLGEGAFLFGSLVALSIPLAVSLRRLKAALTAVIIPLLIIVGGYMLTYYAVARQSPLGTSKYFYTVFEQGHGQAYADRFSGLNYYVEGHMESRRLFGTPEDNHYSVFTAIRRNPTAYLKRIPRLARLAAVTAVTEYGGPLSLWFFLPAAVGCVALLRKNRLLLCTFVLWVSYLVMYVVLVFQPTHLLLPFPVLFCLTAIGWSALITLSTWQRYLWSAMMLGVVATAVRRDVSPAFMSSALVLLIGSWIVWTVVSRYRDPEVLVPSAFVFLLALMLLFREGVPSQRPARLGTAPDERAVLFLQRSFATDAPIAAYPASIPSAARLKRVSLVNGRSELRSEDDLQRWIADHRLEAIYVDSDLRRFESSVWSLIESQIGTTLAVAYSSENDEIQILRVDHRRITSSQR